jgi:hypothetical protein
MLDARIPSSPLGKTKDQDKEPYYKVIQIRFPKFLHTSTFKIHSYLEQSGGQGEPESAGPSFLKINF